MTYIDNYNTRTTPKFAIALLSIGLILNYFNIIHLDIVLVTHIVLFFCSQHYLETSIKRLNQEYSGCLLFIGRLAHILNSFTIICITILMAFKFKWYTPLVNIPMGFLNYLLLIHIIDKDIIPIFINDYRLNIELQTKTKIHKSFEFLMYLTSFMTLLYTDYWFWRHFS
jgi:hypothetical protein